jgi:Restriction endonuclease BglII
LTAFRDLPPHIQALYPGDIQSLYEIHEWRNASVIFKSLHPHEWDELMTVLGGFRLLRSYVAKGGGNKSDISRGLDGHLLRFGWKKETFDTQVTVSTRITPESMTYDVPTHEVDCFKNRVALEVEWNNKDPFFDRDLNNFRLLFDLKAIDIGIIVTRTDALKEIFRQLGRAGSFGESTTHMSKLLPKAEAGGAGGCPVIAFGISPALYVEDDTPLSDEELRAAELIEEAEALLEDEEE